MAPVDAEPIAALVEATKAAREALHDLVLRVRGERPLWERGALALSLRARLTPAQRQRFRDRLAARR